MALKDEYDFDLIINEIQNIVIEELERELAKEEFKDVCRCQDCILDITALALNHLKPAYRSELSFRGLMYKENLHTAKKNSAVEKIVRESIKKIQDNPAH